MFAQPRPLSYFYPYFGHKARVPVSYFLFSGGGADTNEAYAATPSERLSIRSNGTMEAATAIGAAVKAGSGVEDDVGSASGSVKLLFGDIRSM